MYNKYWKIAQIAMLICLLIGLSAIIILRLQVKSEADYEPAYSAENLSEMATATDILATYAKYCNYYTTLDEETETVAEQACNSRYQDISISDDEYEELAKIIFLEANNQSAEGQQAVAEVVLNRVISSQFPDSVHDVIHQGENSDIPQFPPVKSLATATPSQSQYEAIEVALYGENILPTDVVFFSRGAENDHVWGQIGDHIFCYEYSWN